MKAHTGSLDIIPLTHGRHRHNGSNCPRMERLVGLLAHGTDSGTVSWADVIHVLTICCNRVSPRRLRRTSSAFPPSAILSTISFGMSPMPAVSLRAHEEAQCRNLGTPDLTEHRIGSAMFFYGGDKSTPTTGSRGHACLTKCRYSRGRPDAICAWSRPPKLQPAAKRLPPHGIG